MEAYENRLNKVKVPEITTAADQHQSTTVVTTSTVHSLDPGSQADPSGVRETVHVKGQPGIAGEFFVEQVQSIKPGSSVGRPRSPDLTQQEAIVSSEDEYEYDHENLDKDNKPGKVKKVKNRLGKAFRKVFHLDKKEGPHEEPEEHLRHETGNLHDETNTVKLKKEVDIHGHNKNVQDKLENAFATEGLKATRDANMVSQNRYEVPAVVGEFMISSQKTGQPLDLGKLMDIQDHREPEFVKTQETVVKEERRGSRDSAGSGAIRTLRDITQDSGYSSISTMQTSGMVEGVGAGARRDSGKKSPEKLPYSVRRAEMDDPILRDMDVGQLAPLRRNSTERTPIHHGGHHGASEFSHRQHINVHSSPSPDEHDRPVDHAPHITKFENVQVRSHVGGEGHLTRSSEEWDLAAESSRPRTGTGNASSLKEVGKEGEKFSEKFSTMGEKRGSIGSDGKRGSIGGAADRAGAPVSAGAAYEDRLNMAREKWVAPFETRKNENADASFGGLGGAVPARPFERIASDMPLVHGGYTRLNERTTMTTTTPTHDEKVYAFGTYGERGSASRKSMGDTVLHTDLSPHIVNEQPDSQTRPPIRNESYIASMNYGMDTPPHAGDARIAPAVSIRQPVPFSAMDEMKKSEAFLDAELAGNDLARPRQDITVRSTVPTSLEQPVLEVYNKDDGISDVLTQKETTATTATIVRETDRAKGVSGEDDALAAQDEKEIREAEADEEDKTTLTKVMESVGSAVESVEHAVSGMVSSVAGMFTGHKAEEKPTDHAEGETAPHTEEALPTTRVMDYVADKVFSMFTAGTGVSDETPKVEQKNLPEDVETSNNSATPVIPLAVKGEFCEGPTGGVATVPVESVRDSGSSTQSNIALSEVRRESKDI